MTALVAAALLAAAAALLVRPARRRPPVARSGGREPGATRTVGAAASRRGWAARAGLLAAVVCAVAAPVLGPPSGGPPVAFLLLLPAVLLAVRRRVVGAARDTAVTRRRAEVATAVSALGAQLRAGRSPRAALAESARHCPTLQAAAAVAVVGADVPAALRRAAGEPGADALALVAAGWALSETTGAPLAGLVGTTAQAVREQEALARQVAAELAPVRSTARLLAVLPVGTLALASALGGSPVAVLLGTPWGAASGVAGVGLAGLGLAWVGRIARAASRPPEIAVRDGRGAT